MDGLILVLYTGGLGWGYSYLGPLRREGALSSRSQSRLKKKTLITVLDCARVRYHDFKTKVLDHFY